MTTYADQSYRSMQETCCVLCQRPFPRLVRQPFPADMVLRWNDTTPGERRLLIQAWRWHQVEPFHEWTGLMLRDWGLDRGHVGPAYRAFQNSVRRLKSVGSGAPDYTPWVQRVSRGRYRLTSYAVAQMAWGDPSWTTKRFLTYQTP